MKYSSDTLK